MQAVLSTRPEYARPWRSEYVWIVRTASGRKWIKAFPKRESTMTNKGYREGTEQAPAEAVIAGSGTGLAGAASCSIQVIRKDSGYPANAVLG